MEPVLFLIDGTGLLYRAHFAFIRNPLINSSGFDTSALFGTINSFLKLLDSFSPEHIAISFDRKEPTFRHKLTDIYKANRPPMPEPLVAQLEPVHRFFRLIGVPEYSCAGFEADDVLATLARRFKDRFEIVIVTSDKDYTQLVDDRVTLWDPFKETRIDPETAEARYDLEPDRFIDYLALVGDSSDNIPGAKGIGPKGASKLLKQFGSIDGIYRNLEEISTKSIRAKLEAARDDVMMSRDLARIRTDVPIEEIPVERMRFHAANLASAIPLCDEFELESIRKRIASADGVPDDVQPGITFEDALLDTPDKLEKALEALSKTGIVALDTETTSIDPMQAELVGISLCFEEHRAFYIPIAHQFSDNLDSGLVLSRLADVLNGKTIVGHHFKYDSHVLHRAGWDVFGSENLNGRLFDTMIASYILDAGEMHHSLDACSKREFNYSMIPISDLIGKGRNQIGFDAVEIEKACRYAAEDAALTFRLYHTYHDRLRETGLNRVFREIEIPLIPVLEQMERNGVFVDENILGELSRQNKSEMNKVEKDIFDAAGETFNINSTKQLGAILFDKLEIPPVKKTKTGYSTDSSVLEKLAEDHQIARYILRYRQLAKLESTYIEALPRMIDPQTGRIHTSFNQTIASTGRLSSTSPNLQNIPIRTPEGRQIRRAFRAGRDGWRILAADYSQIELRIMALLSGDDNLLQAFRNREDIHRQTAARIYDIEPEDVTKMHRSRAKVINFGIMYGMGPQRLGRELEISTVEAKDFIEQYFQKFPTIRAFIDSQVDNARQKGYAETIFGRRLYLPGLRSSNQRAVSEAERVAVNMPIQGSAADLIKRAMIRIDKKIRDRHDIVMMLQVHDELVFEVNPETLDETRELIVTEMESVLPALYRDSIPLSVETGVGENWFEAH